jgi:ketosteroid isomerase-like protein
MSEQENVQIVQDLYTAFGRGDMPTILGLLAEDVDWHFVGKPADVPFAGCRKGHQEMIEFFTIVAQNCEVYEFGPHEVLSFADHVISIGHERVGVKSTGRTFETDWVHLFTIQDGKIARLQEFYDTATMAVAFRP